MRMVTHFVPGRLYRYSNTYSARVLQVLEAGVERFRCLVVTNSGRIVESVMWAADWKEINP